MRKEEDVPAFISVRNERTQVVVNSCKRGLGSRVVSLSQRTRATKLREKWKRKVDMFRRAVSMKVAIDDKKASNITTACKRKKAGSKTRGADNAAFDLCLHSLQ